MKGLILALAMLLATPVAAKPVGFATDIAPTLKTRCAVCHLTGQEAGNLALHPKAAYASLFRRKSGESSWLLVDPKQPDTSYLVMKLEGTHLKKGGKGARMPFAAPPLDASTVAVIRRWISEGATNN